MSNKLVTLAWKVSLPAPQKIYLVRCADRADDGGGSIFLSIDRIAEDTGLSRSSVFRASSSLKKSGLVVDDTRAPRRRSATRLIRVDLLRELARQGDEMRQRNRQGHSRTGASGCTDSPAGLQAVDAPA